MHQDVTIHVQKMICKRRELYVSKYRSMYHIIDATDRAGDDNAGGMPAVVRGSGSRRATRTTPTPDPRPAMPHDTPA